MAETLHDKKMKELMKNISPEKILDAGGGSAKHTHFEAIIS